MYVLTAPPNISQFQASSGAQYTVSSGTITVPLTDLRDALISGFALSSAGSSSQTISGAAGTLALSTIHTYLFVNTLSGAASFALPAAGILGRSVTMIDFNGNAPANNITTAIAGGGTINGSPSLVTDTTYAIVTFIDNGTNWNI
ncbi:MAG TPA: hypothetical protein VHW09_26750 [Bryobacteraceae bacterium]|jgi:hypothetical protein|nr:hypothetical protein [Bryobacteraceae bacterium]